jgi:flavin-dependent dehydrogenase
MSADIETIVVGAGVVGLAIARALALAGHEVMVLEQHGLIGSEILAQQRSYPCWALLCTRQLACRAVRRWQSDDV